MKSQNQLPFYKNAIDVGMKDTCLGSLAGQYQPAAGMAQTTHLSNHLHWHIFNKCKKIRLQ